VPVDRDFVVAGPDRLNAFVAIARLIADVSRDLGTRGASGGVLDALTTAAPPELSIHWAASRDCAATDRPDGLC
jgi:hypothetical protein